MATTTIRWTRAAAATVLAEQKTSGLCIAQFAQTHKFNPKRLYRWRQRLKSPDDAAAPRSTPAATAALFPVEVIRAAPPQATAGRSTCLSLRTAAGHAIDIPSGFDGDTLLRILDVLAAAKPC